ARFNMVVPPPACVSWLGLVGQKEFPTDAPTKRQAVCVGATRGIVRLGPAPAKETWPPTPPAKRTSGPRAAAPGTASQGSGLHLPTGPVSRAARALLGITAPWLLPRQRKRPWWYPCRHHQGRDCLFPVPGGAQSSAGNKTVMIGSPWSPGPHR